MIVYNHALLIPPTAPVIFLLLKWFTNNHGSDYVPVTTKYGH
jgi:hypothetical protein